MDKIWDNKWLKILVWVSGYINFIAFAIVGGYVIAKSQDEELRKETKKAFIVTLVFTALLGLILIFNTACTFSSSYEFIVFTWVFTLITLIGQFITYLTFILLVAFPPKKMEKVTEAKVVEDKQEEPEKKDEE